MRHVIDHFILIDSSANIQSKDLSHYKASKEKFATAGNMKKANFAEAIRQIEEALNGDDAVPDACDVSAMWPDGCRALLLLDQAILDGIVNVCVCV